MISKKKLQAEGGLEESKTILGWSIDFHNLIISLTIEKHVDWSNQLSLIMEKKVCTLKELNNLVGYLNHACNTIPLGNHFLNRLRAKIDNKRNRKSFVKLESRHLEDLSMWEQILMRTK